MRAALALVLALARLAHAASFTTTSEMLGTIAGPTIALAQPGLAFYGTDLGWTVEHDGTLLMLFGDTWPRAHFLCETVPTNDDCQATLPLARPTGAPSLTFATHAGAPTELDPIRVFRGTESLGMGFIRTRSSPAIRTDPAASSFT